MTIHKSAEDYLEAMLMLKEERGYIRSIDVAEKLGVTKPSVSYATKRLRESGYIALDPAGMIVLLQPGLEIAERMYERHKLLTELLMGLGFDRAPHGPGREPGHRPAGRLRDRARPERGDLRRYPQARPAVSLRGYITFFGEACPTCGQAFSINRSKR